MWTPGSHSNGYTLCDNDNISFSHRRTKILYPKAVRALGFSQRAAVRHVPVTTKVTGTQIVLSGRIIYNANEYRTQHNLLDTCIYKTGETNNTGAPLGPQPRRRVLVGSNGLEAIGEHSPKRLRGHQRRNVIEQGCEFSQ